jgi:hypothetical protein
MSAVRSTKEVPMQSTSGTEADPADVWEQMQDVDNSDPFDASTEGETPLEASEGDVAEQRIDVPLEDDEREAGEPGE